MKGLSRRSWLQAAGVGTLGAGLFARRMAGAQGAGPDGTFSHGSHVMGAVGRVSTESFDPMAYLRAWNFTDLAPDRRSKFYRETARPDGSLLREYEIFAVDREIEIAPGVFFPAWTYNGQVPGPTYRCRQGDLLRVRFHNASSMPHTIHFHGIHAARMDGIPGAGLVQPGESFTYEFDALPFGCHLYHCHSLPLKRHIHKGLYGAFIVDPDPERHPLEREVAESRLLGSSANQRWQEVVLVMNGFDTNFDDENEFYAVNSIPFVYAEKGIRVERSRPLRVYLINVTEFDPINSLHLHANFFNYFD
ncbi:MAG: multicopper oxidase domain-containing protein, partial [Gammaproteobacteria bacterium]